jgi:hypothetical protein
LPLDLGYQGIYCVVGGVGKGWNEVVDEYRYTEKYEEGCEERAVTWRVAGRTRESAHLVLGCLEFEIHGFLSFYAVFL